MSIWVVQKQMIMIFVFILIGVYLYKKGHLSNMSSRQLSWIIVNITNPITLLCAALKEEEKVPAGELGIAFLCFVLMYAMLIPLAYLIPLALGIEKEDRYAYRMMSIFGNVGFIGIPFAAAVLGTKSLIFVSICGLTFNLIAYTYGMAVMRKIGDEQHPDRHAESTFTWKNVINSGTVISILAILLYIADFPVPEDITTGLSYIGNTTTFMSMIVLGVSVAQMVPKEVFSKWRLYVFVILRQIIVPIILIFILRPFIKSELILSTVVVMAAMPAANMPLMMAKQYGVKDDIISAGIILTTLLSIVTIPVVMMFL